MIRTMPRLRKSVTQNYNKQAQKSSTSTNQGQQRDQLIQQDLPLLMPLLLFGWLSGQENEICITSKIDQFKGSISNGKYMMDNSLVWIDDGIVQLYDISFFGIYIICGRE